MSVSDYKFTWQAVYSGTSRVKESANHILQELLLYRADREKNRLNNMLGKENANKIHDLMTQVNRSQILAGW